MCLQCRRCRRARFHPWVGRISWRRKRLLTPVFWPREFHCIVHGVAKSQTRLRGFHFSLPLVFWTPGIVLIPPYPQALSAQSRYTEGTHVSSSDSPSCKCSHGLWFSSHFVCHSFQACVTDCISSTLVVFLGFYPAYNHLWVIRISFIFSNIVYGNKSQNSRHPLLSISCDRLCDPMDCSLPGSIPPPGKNIQVDCHFLLQGIFPTQRWNPHLLHWQAHSLPLSHRKIPLANFILTKVMKDM